MADPATSIDLGDFASELGGTCREYLESHTERLQKAIREGESGTEVASRHSRMLDGLLGSLFCATHGAAQREGGQPVGRVALVGVGGYGRGLVALHSDVDVVFLCDEPDDPRIRALAEGVLYPLWDLGLSIGHAVRGVNETLELSTTDIRTATTLLDMRTVAGDQAITRELRERGREQIFGARPDPFLDALEVDTRDRHERYGGSLYLLEPEIKYGRGGLRDFDVIVWTMRARWGVDAWEELVDVGALLDRELEQLRAAQAHLWRVRNLLHLRAGRRQDRLTFEDQEEIADLLGYTDGATLGVEQFMQTHYRHAQAVTQMLDWTSIRARRSDLPPPAVVEDLGRGLVIRDEHVGLASEEVLAQDPAVALRLYRQVIRHDLPPEPEARDAIGNMRADPAWCQRLRASQEASGLFLRFLTHIQRAPVPRHSLFGELHEVGLLLAMIPEFEAVTGRVQHDVYHVYTVDVHSVAAVKRLHALSRGDFAAEFPTASRLAAEAPRPGPLYVGLLLHDVGKQYGRDHARKGAEMAGPVAERLGLEPADVEHVVWLVAEHLHLYHWAMRRDISDPETIGEVARQVETVHRLEDLYVLTVADLSTTSPTAMTQWKSRMLEDLLVAVTTYLEGQGPSAVRHQVQAVRKQAAGAFAYDPDREALLEFLRDMPDRYLLSNPVEAIRFHARFAVDRGRAKVAVGTRPGFSEDTLECVVATDDRPGLLVAITAALAKGGFSVDSAQLYTRERDGRAKEAFDVFHVSHPLKSAESEPDAEIEALQQDIQDLVDGRVTPEELVSQKPSQPSWAVRKGPDVRTEIHVDNHASSRYTVVDIFTRDRAELLYAVAKTLYDRGLTIALAKVSTEGMRVADVFYVQTSKGRKLPGTQRLAQLSVALRETLQALDADDEGAVWPPRA